MEQRPAPVDHRRLECELQDWLGTRAKAACRSTEDGDLSRLEPTERAVVRGAIERRQREFAAGRSAARDAMRRLGWPGAPIPAHPDRSPCWPNGLVGSISHCRTSCVAVVADRRHWTSVGVDVEIDQDLSPDLWSSICTSDELLQAGELPAPMRARWVTRLFCAKETYYKWVYPHIRTLLDFQDVAIDLEPALGEARFAVRPLTAEARDATPCAIEGRLAQFQGLVISLMIH
ncbi:MAG: 4'-phosphopantetheinyl transferase superfamily protein [Burkholderiaceae bacterium]